MVQIDSARDALLPEISKVTLRKKYMLPTEVSPQETFRRASMAYASDPDHAQRLYDYSSKLWFGYSSPLLSNAGTQLGLPISCYLNYVDDSRAGLSDHFAECLWLSTMGGGIGGYWGHIRSDGTETSRGSESTGSIPWMKVIDSLMLAAKQGKVRRGKYSFNMDISHPEIEEFIHLINKKGGDENRRARQLFNCVSIPDSFMYALAQNGKWDLIDPHSKKVTKTINAVDLWNTLLLARLQEGAPYIHFIDHSRRAMPQAQKNLGLDILQTNLCSEIILPTNNDRTAICCLSSVNLETYDQWKDNPRFIPDLITMLDNVISSFIDTAPPHLHKAIYSATQERSVGLGAMGWHSYLQSKQIAFESALAISVTRNIFSKIKEQAVNTTKQLAVSKGACPDSINGNDGYLVRNMHLLAIAPNATSSIICGNTSPSVEPMYSNVYTQKTQNGTFKRLNKYLEPYLEQYGLDGELVIKSIGSKNGSVQHLALPDDVKKVFKTAFEINPLKLILQASHRQEFLCQSQSINLFIPPYTSIEQLHSIHYYAWLNKLKTLYYVRSRKAKQAEVLNLKVDNEAIDSDTYCLACEG